MCDLQSCGDETGTTALPAVTPLERRNFLKGLASLPLATILAYPDLARAAAERLEPLSVKTLSGIEAQGVFALPERTPAPGILLIHEWWGLNDQIKAVTLEFAKQGFLAVAADLYGGEVATSRAEASQLTKAVDPTQAKAQLVTLLDWLRGHPDGTGKVGTVGWCYGGGWSLRSSLAAPVDATVVYYGDVRKSAADLKALKGPVLGHFGTLDQRINAEMVSGFESAMSEAGKDDLTVCWYEADHAFANPSGARYDEADAQLSWQRTLDFFRANLL